MQGLAFARTMGAKIQAHPHPENSAQRIVQHVRSPKVDQTQTHLEAKSWLGFGRTRNAGETLTFDRGADDTVCIRSNESQLPTTKAISSR